MRASRIVLPLLALAACSEEHGHGRDHDEVEHKPHAHESPRGGQLVELGDHMAQLDFVLDADTGTLHAYVMDGHASESVRIEMKAIPVTVTIAGEDLVLELEAQADELSGETVGDTSHFMVQSDRLRNARGFEGSVGRIEVYGTAFTDVEFTYEPAGAE